MRAAARRFGEVRTEDLGWLPARVMARLLGEDGLAAGSEDAVNQAVATYVEARDARDGGGGAGGAGADAGGSGPGAGVPARGWWRSG